MTTGDAEMHAFAHNGLAMQDLGTLGGAYSTGFGVSESGQIIGDSTLADETQSHAFVFANGVMQDLGTLGGTSSTPWAINSLGQIVGESSDAAGAVRAYIWENGLMVDLNSLLPSGSGWNLNTAYFINDAGDIVGVGTYQGQPAWFLMRVHSAANQPPVANAGPDQSVECTGDTTAVLLDGSASSDPDGNALTFEWFVGGKSLGTSAKLALGVSLGSYTFTLRVSDGSGGSAEDTVVVNVVDTTAPLVQCPTGGTVSPDSQGRAVVPDFLSGLVVSDNCTPASGLVVTQSPTNGTLVGCGTVLVTITASDAAGNQSICTTTFTVADVTPPVVCCPKEITRSARTNCQAAVPNLLSCVSAHDNFTPADQLVKSQTPLPGTFLGLGQHEIRISVADAAGNVTTCIVLFNVVDRRPPHIRSLQANPAFLRDGSREMVPVTLSVVASDNCDPNPVCRIVSVTSSDPATGLGDNTSTDWEITGDLTVRLRAERSAPTKLRVYTIKLVCIDARGNSSMRSVFVPVQAAPRLATR
jgi:probable HAF family extracellular repeat protein